MHYIFLSIAILTEVCGTMALHATRGFTVLLPSLVVIIAYACSFYFLSLTLGKIPVAVAYSIWSGVGIGLITVVSYLWLGQALNPWALIGIALIAVGIILITLFGNTTLHG